MKRLIALISVFAALAVWAERVPPGTAEEIRSRLAPVGELCVAGEDCGTAVAAADSGGPMSGAEVFDSFCVVCHGTGVGGAPVFGNAGDWAPHLDKGTETLWNHTLNGFNAMPPKGTCVSCSNEELRAAMNYMVDAAK